MMHVATSSSQQPLQTKRTYSNPPSSSLILEVQLKFKFYFAFESVSCTSEQKKGGFLQSRIGTSLASNVAQRRGHTDGCGTGDEDDNRTG